MALESLRWINTKSDDSACSISVIIYGGKAVDVARTLGREPSYVSRMLYPEGKKAKKRIADEMVELIESSFNLPRGWMDGITGNIDIEREPVEDSPQMPYVIEVLDAQASAGQAALSPVRLMKR